jgi:hypothetical protein
VTATDEAVLPGSGARLRSVWGVTGPQDVPLWMTRGGGSARTAAAAVAADAAVARRAGGALGSVLLDAGSALGWRGSAAQAGQARARGLSGQLAVVAAQLDVAHGALLGLAAALDAQQPVLGSVSTVVGSWASTDQGQRSGLLARWAPAVSALDGADVRTAQTLAGVASALGRVRVAVGQQGWLAANAPGSARSSGASSETSVLEPVAQFVGEACARTVDGAASLVSAAGQHPGAAAEFAAGLWLTSVGASGELAGTALDLTVVGSAVGLPVNAASAGAIAAGVGLMTMGAGQIGTEAAGDDHVTSAGSASGSTPPRTVDIENANYAQRSASWRFSKDGRFRGQTIGQVSRDLGLGRLTPEDVPIDVIVRGDRTLILNTRSATALERGRIPRTKWRTLDRTGQPGYEARLSRQLKKNGLGNDGISSVELDLREW